MKRLLRIGCSTFILSFIPIISWFLIGVILDPNYINVFSITYPIQFVSWLILSIFSVGANVSQYKDKKENSILSGMTLGLVVTIICAVIGIFITEPYLVFMNVDVAFYKDFVIYDILSIFIRTLFSMVLQKLYFEEKDKKATIYSIVYNCLNLIVFVGLALITKNHAIIIGVTLSIMVLYTLVLFFMQYKKFCLSFNILSNIKYESENIIIDIALFITYFVGFSNTFVFGEEYIAAINFITLITDPQWDACEAIKTVAKIDIVNKQYNFKKSTLQSLAYIGILLSTSVVMFFSLFSLYEIQLSLGLIYLGCECLAFLLSAMNYYFEPVCQLEYSPTKNTIFSIVSYTLRTILSISIPLAFCTQIGQLSACILLIIVMLIIKKKYFTTNQNGYLVNKKEVE